MVKVGILDIVLWRAIVCYKHYCFLYRENIGGHLITQEEIFNVKITQIGSFEPVARQK
ncbi:hypothetical protein D3C87_1150150 [compost metagenome]